MKRLVSEFREFLLKQNALALAIGVIIGGAVGKVVGGIVDDLFMPIIGILLPGGEWRTAKLTLSGNNAILYGDLLGRVIDFVLVASVVFLVTRLLLAKPATPSTKTCKECLEAIPIAAQRCRACGQRVQ